ncbi:flagellar hook assembly protein FlgD [Sulfitobacter mediterraneus]|uniref:flagellar hook assembly protein FlgD n=1 Tax=Sulfitobacter mediterraneus TaxID=83219 RepID=UPI0019318FA6|nr:flagellar hook capping FlgD N-terminal domain-containing protein [Sulfitobacter mediterraneus]MBM1312039.1 flagellar hook assembly protein FlgD [Sulfitobacter mediterraneus]MBM1315919.1 flagellar hook assembly protein FlgD [Sulfitobacter mediterraneus]MBM1324282.1 flagellar hook assembly protein FlgD [Sulfitobacter mediterraneus]MBM1328193.1 flagellar hook assembly protein FlgD [Sulfitobacter mediterraneus]MBM1399542.1 flagellar hook assembly protein FlgD [Sulfitobacter mediterraneus]
MLTSPDLLTSLANGNQTDSANSLSQLGDDYTQFLSLLTAQVQFQDPLEPVDSTQFIAQLAQLSQVEQAVQQNAQLETLTDQISGLLNLGGTDLLGRSVTVQSNLAVLENGTTDTSFELEAAATEVTARIIDPQGLLVRTLSGYSGQPGVEIPLGWDGRNNQGDTVLEGRYVVQVTAKDANGESVAVELTRDAVVEEVRFHEGEIIFGLDSGEDASSVTVKSAS